MNSNEYFEYILSDNYLCPKNNNINESYINSLYENESNYFANVQLSDILPLMYIIKNNKFTESDLVLLESGYEQYATAQPLNEFMGNSQHLYGNQIGVGATDWMRGMNGPLKWLGYLIGGTFMALLGLLGWLLKKGKQLVGVALLRRYIEKIAAITDEGYKNMCNLFTSRKNRPCFKSFQQASERDIIVSVDVCAKALGLLNNSLDYKEDQNPYIQAETLISDVHDEYLEDIAVSNGWFGMNKLIDKPQEKIDNTKDLAEKYNIKIKDAYGKNQESNHQENIPASNESYSYSEYSSLNEYKKEEEHYSSTENYAKYLDAYLVVVRNAWETLCKRLIGEIRIGDEVEYIKQNQKLNIQNSNTLPNAPTKFNNYVSKNPPGESAESWLMGLVQVLYRKDENRLNKIFRDFSEDDVKVKNIWSLLKKSYLYWRTNKTSENMNVIWKRATELLNKLSINESVLYNDQSFLTEARSGEGINTWRNEDIDNNLIQQMSNWLQRYDRFEWKITKDFKKKCTELAIAVDKEIITRINRWTTTSGAPGSTGLNNKGYNSPVTKAGLEKLWTAYKEELNNRIEARVDKFVTGNPFMYATQFLQFTVPSLMKDVLNKVNPENMERDNTYTFNYGIIQNHFTLGDLIESDDDNMLGSSGIINITPISDEEREIIRHSQNEQNESYTLFKGTRFRLFEAEDEMNNWNSDDDDSDHDDIEFEDNQNVNNNLSDNQASDMKEYSLVNEQQESKMLISGYSVAIAFIQNNDIDNTIQNINNALSHEHLKYMFIPGINCHDGNPPLKAVADNKVIGKICKDNKIYSPLGENIQIYYFDLDNDNTDKSPKYLKELDVKQLVELYKNSLPQKSNSKAPNESIEYSNYNILNENNDDNDLDDSNITVDDNLNNKENSKNQSGKEDSPEWFISGYSIIKFPLFWYGNKIMLPENELTEDWLIMQIPDSMKSKFLESAVDLNQDENKNDQSKGIYWPVDINTVDDNKNESVEFSYTAYSSINEDTNMVNIEDVPTDDKSSNENNSNNQTSGNLNMPAVTTAQGNSSNKPSFQAAEEEKNKFEQLNKEVEDQKNRKKEDQKYGELTLLLNDNVKDKGILIKDPNFSKSSDFNLKLSFTTDKKQGTEFIFKNNSWEPDLNKESIKQGIKSIIFENIQGLWAKPEFTEKKDMIYLKFDNLYAKIINVISNDILKYENTKIKQIIPNISIYANDQSWKWEDCLNDDKNKYTKSPVKQKDIIIIEKQ